jgi:rhodanese-related sulfurtransferase
MQIKSIDPVSLKKRLDEGKALLIDVREPHEHAREHIEGARLAPLSRFHSEDFSEHHDKTAVFYCHSGGRTGSNARLLASKGFRDAFHLSGGIMAWKAAGLPTQSKRPAAGEGGRKRFGWLFSAA